MRRILRKMRIDEISAVDNPAQVPATVAIMKRGEPVEKVEPKKGEGEDDFISRFMGSAAMRAEFPDAKQRAAVARSKYKQAQEKPKKVSKRSALTSEVGGHVHSLQLDCGQGDLTAGQTNYVRDAQDQEGHAHSWIMLPNGDYVIGSADGHSHEVASVSKQLLPDEGNTADLVTEGTDPADPQAADGGTREINMTPEEKAAIEKAAAEQKTALEAMQKRAERAEKLVELTDSQKAILAKLDERGKETFLALTPEKRQDEVAKAVALAADSNPVVHTDLDGNQFRKCDDPRLVMLSKRADAERTARLDAEKVVRLERLQKRAADLKHLPGDQETKVALLEAIESIPLGRREKVEQLLKAQDNGLAAAFRTSGVAGQPSSDKPESQLDAMAKELRRQDPKLTEEQAMVKAMFTPEGKALYAKHVLIPKVGAGA